MEDDTERICRLVGEINEETVSTLIVALHNMMDSTDPITLVIDSEGGSLEEGFRLIDAINSLEDFGIHVNAVVQGKAYSMAAFIFAACRSRTCYPHARFMLHRPRYDGVPSDSQYTSTELLQMYQEMRYYETETERLLENIGMDRETMNTLLSKDSYFDPEYARLIGLVQTVSAKVI